MLTGGMTFSRHRVRLPALQVTTIWYRKRFGKSKEITLRSLEAMMAHTLPFSVLTLIAWATEPWEGICPVMAGLLIVTSGLMTDVLEAVQCILVVRIVPRQGLAKRTVVATSREAIALGSGVSGVLAMVQWWCSGEEEVAVTEQTMVLVSLRITTEHLKNGKIQERTILEIVRVLPLILTRWICGFADQNEKNLIAAYWRGLSCIQHTKY